MSNDVQVMNDYSGGGDLHGSLVLSLILSTVGGSSVGGSYALSHAMPYPLTQLIYPHATPYPILITRVRVGYFTSVIFTG